MTRRPAGEKENKAEKKKSRRTYARVCDARGRADLSALYVDGGGGFQARLLGGRVGPFRAVAAMSTADAATGLTISGALESLNRDVEIRQARLVKELGGKEEFRSFLAPDTLTQAITDAQAAQQALAELGGGKKRKLVDEAAEATKKWALPPGESLVNPDVAPFLAYNEEYFRHITPEDVANLVPDGARRVEEDPDFRIPALGRYYVLGELEPDIRAVIPLDLRRDRRSLRLPSLPRRTLSSHRLFLVFFFFFFFSFVSSCFKNTRK